MHGGRILPLNHKSRQLMWLNRVCVCVFGTSSSHPKQRKCLNHVVEYALGKNLMLHIMLVQKCCFSRLHSNATACRRMGKPNQKMHLNIEAMFFHKERKKCIGYLKIIDDRRLS